MHKSVAFGCFSREEAMELIAGPSREAGLSLKPHADFIPKVAGRFPFLLQMACCSLFEYPEIHPAKCIPDRQFMRIALKLLYGF